MIILKNIYYFSFRFKLGNRVFLEQNMLYDLREKDESIYDYNNFEKIWTAYKKKKGNPLIKSLFHAFKGNFTLEI